MAIRPVATLGTHLLSELSGCAPEKLSNLALLSQVLLSAAQSANEAVLSSTLHRFSLSGIQGVLCLAEARFSIQTWPEFGYAAVDVHVCGAAKGPRAALEYLAKALGALHQHTLEVERGVNDANGVFGSRVLSDAPPNVVSDSETSTLKPGLTANPARKRYIPTAINLS